MKPTANQHNAQRKASGRLNHKVIVTTQISEKESMKKLNCQNCDSSQHQTGINFSEISATAEKIENICPNRKSADMPVAAASVENNNPLLQLQEKFKPAIQLWQKAGIESSQCKSDMHRLKPMLLFGIHGLKPMLHLRHKLMPMLLWFTRPYRVRQALVWLLAFIIFAQPNMAVAQVLTASTPYERARQAAIAASLPASSPSWFTKLARQIPDLTPVVSTIVNTAKAAFFLAFPFEESEGRKPNAGLSTTSENLAPANSLPATGNAGSTFNNGQTLRNLLASPVSWTTPAAYFQSSAQLTDSAISLLVPTLNNGRIEGNLRVFEGRSFNINSGFQLTQDLFLVGTPTITVNSGSSYGGTIDDGGATTPSYTIILNSGVNLPGKFHIHANAISLPSDIPTSVPQPSGTRDLNINNAGDVNNIGDWATVRSLNINVANLTITVPPGNYQQITMNGASRLAFANGTYNFSNTINLNSGSSIQATGTVIINIGQSMNINGASTVVAENTSIGSLKLNVLGTTLNLNSNTIITGFVRAPNAAMNIQGNSKVRGQVIAKEVRLSGGEILGDSTAPTVSITSPANGFSTTQSTITVSGTAADGAAGANGIARVTVNNTPAVYNSSTGTWSIANVPLNVGANTITAKAEDLYGNTFTAQITVTRQEIQQDTTPPQLVITTPANNTTTQADTITVSGTVSDPAPNPTGVASVTVNNIAATRDIAAGTWTSTVALQMGANTITVRATDGAGNVSTQTRIVTREQAPPPDTAPPVVTITSPANNAVTGDVSITVSGTAVDPGSNASGVLKVTINGVDATFDAGNNTWTATGIGLQNGNNRIVAQAEDRAHNIGSAEINVRKANPPTLTITNPQTGAVISSSSVTVAGTVSSDSPDVTVSVTVNGQAASIAGGQFTKAITLASGTNTITVVATDSLNQTSQSSITVIQDQTPPTAELTGVPTSVQAGNNYTITANASDETGVESVEFAVDGQPFVSDIAAPYQFTLSVPANAVANQVIVISAVVRNSAGLTATATARTRVSGPGGVSGYVFDDATGYGIAGVAASFTDGLSANTDADGSFIYVSNVASGLARMVKAGYTVVERAYTFSDGGGSSLFDARLTSLDSNANAIGAQGGTATGDSGRVSVAFGAGAFADGSDVRITSVSPQGLINLLPFGWSPVPGAVIDIRRSDPALPLPNTFPSSAHLTINETSGLAAGTRLVLVRYNETTHNWITVNNNITAGTNGALQADILTAGQYAFLVADTGTTAPPAAVAGQPLTSSASVDSALLETATAFATSSPRSSIISAEARSTIGFIARAAAKLPSGVAIEASFGETYNLLSQSNPLLVDRPSQDFVLYSYPAATQEEPNRLGAFFIAKPTRFELTITQLRTANIHVVIRSGRPLTTGTLVGTTGGQVTTPDGATSLDIAAGALPAPTPVFIEAVRPADVDLSLPAGYEIVGAVNLDLSSTVLSTGGTISVPTVSGDLSRIVVARAISAGGRRAPKIVARATEVSGKLRSTTATPTVPNGVTLSGVNVGGLYLFIRVPAAFGYLSGTVSASSQPAAMVRVAVNQTPFADVTGADGRYVIVGAVGANNLDAASLVTDATGAGTAAISGQNAIVDTAIAIASVPLSVQSVTPANNSANIIVTTPITVTFSKPVAVTSLTGSTFKVTTAAGNPVLGSITMLAGNRIAVFTPQSNLVGSTSYKVTLTTAVKDIYGGALSAAFESMFSTAAVVSADNRLKPENVSLSYPNAQGFVTLTIPAGTVPTGSTIVLINNASGATVTTVAGSAEISLQIQAQVGDEITILVRQPDGTEYRINQAAYKKADGSTTIGRNGGTVSSADGESVLTVPKNAIMGQVDLKLTPKVESDIAIPRVNEMDPANMPFGAGVEISAQGSFTVEKELHLELPAPANAVEGRRAAFLKPSKVTEDGQEVDVWEVVTSGRVEGGKLKTNSPPFLGLAGLSPITTIWSFMPVQQRIALGTISEPTSSTDPTLRPVPNVLCILGGNMYTGLANHLTARTNSDGYYAIFDVNIQAAGGAVVYAIDDTNGRRGLGAPAPYTNAEIRFLQGLQGFVLFRTDITLAARSGGGGGQNAPQITLKARSTSDSEPEANDPLVQLGIVQIPSHIRVSVRTDRAIGAITGSVLVGSASSNPLSWQLAGTETGPNGQQFQTYESSFDVASEGGYRINVTANTVAGDATTATTASYGFLASRNPNTRPPLPGNPYVLSSFPRDGSVNVDVTTDVRLEFSEYVVNLQAGQTVYLLEDGKEDIQANRIGGTLTSGGVVVQPDSQNISSIVFRPSKAFDSGKKYTLKITSDVRDTVENLPVDQDNTTPGIQPFSASFTTFGGLVLNDNPVPESGSLIAMSGNFVVTVTADILSRSLVHTFDVADPQNPVKTGELVLPQRAYSLDVSEETTYKTQNAVFTRVAAIATSDPLRPTVFANVWFINLDFPEDPNIVGVASLYIPEGLPTTPLSVRIRDGKAFIGNTPYRGVIAVDIARALDMYAFYPRASEVPKQLALTPGVGFALETRQQSVRYQLPVTQPSPASSIAVLEQTVTSNSAQGTNPHGTMDVVYAANTADKQLVSIGIAPAHDGNNDFVDVDGQGADDRILARKAVVPQDSTPARVKTVAGVTIGSQRKDLALLMGANRLWIFDTADPVNPSQYPSLTYAEMGWQGDASASYMEVEGTLAYVLMGNKIAVIDFSNPAQPRVVATISGVGNNLSGIAVKEGFVFTVSPGTDTRDGLNVSIARPASIVMVHGFDESHPDELCANPVVINRQTRVMEQKADVFFQVFGQQLPSSAQVIIRKNEEILDTISATNLSASTSKVVKGNARWRTTTAIDRAALYTAEVILDPNGVREYHARREPIPFSFLIGDYQSTIGVTLQKPGSSAAQYTALAESEPYFSYLLGSKATVTIKIDGQIKLPGVLRSFGLNTESTKLPGSFAAPGIIPGLNPGRYSVTLTASMSGSPSVVDEVQATLIIARNANDMRAPGHLVVSDVDVFTGNLGLSETDIEIPNRGLSLALTRSYNTQRADTFNPFGYGWGHNYQVLLVRTTTDQGAAVLTVQGGDGEGQEFLEGPTGTPMPALPPHQGSLVKNADGSYDFYTKTRRRYHFPGIFERDSRFVSDGGYMGNLEFIEEPHGQRIQLQYGQGRLEHVVDSSGRSLNFTYERALTPFVGLLGQTDVNKNRTSCLRKGQFGLIANQLTKAELGQAWRITKVTGPGALEIAYEYDADGNLIKVSRKSTDAISQAAPQDWVWQYAYKPAQPANRTDDLSHLLKSATSPNGKTINYNYDFSKQPGFYLSRIDYPAGINNTFAFTLTNGLVNSAVVTDGNGTPTTYEINRQEDAQGVSNGHIVMCKVGLAGIFASSEMRFDKQGLKTYEKDPEGLITQIVYQNGNPITETKISPESGEGQLVTSYVYSTANSLLYSKPDSITDANGNQTTYQYNGQGDLIKSTLPTGQSMLMTYQGNGDLQTVTDERGLITTYAYDAFGNPISVNRETGRTGQALSSTSTFDSRSRMLTTQSTLGQSITNTYDALDRVVSVQTTDPSGIRDSFTSTYTYKNEGQVEKVITSGGGQTYQVDYAYDALERTQEVSETGTGIGTLSRVYTYDSNSNMRTMTDRRGVTTTYFYNELNFPTGTRVEGAFGPSPSLTTTTVPDRVGNVTRQTDIYGNDVSYRYDGFHRLKKIIYPGLYEENFVVDKNGNILKYTDRNQHDTTTSYDSLNRPTLRTNAENHRTTWTYDDAAGKLTMEQQPQGLTTETTTDGLNRPLSQITRFGTTQYQTSYAYNGREVTITDPRGTVTKKKLSSFGEIGETSVQIDNGTTLKTEMRYAAQGGLKSFTDASNRTTNFVVDVLGRTTSVTYPTSPAVTEQYIYDGEGLLRSHTDRRGILTTQTYDNMGRLLVTTTGGIAVMSQTYDDSQRKVTKTDANNHSTICVYDGLKRLASVTNADGKIATYEYDGINQIKESDFKGKKTEFAYDAINRLVSMKDRTGEQITTISHSDSGGHRMTTTDRRGNQRIEVADPLGRVTSITEGGQALASFEYDGNSNRVAAIDGRNNRTTTVYDKVNRVLSVNHANLQTESYTYDAVGNVLSYNDGDGPSVSMTYDGLNHLVTRTDEVGNITRTKYDGAGLLLEQVEPKGAGFKTTYDYNALGSLREVRDARGGVWSYGYDSAQNLTGMTDALSRLTSYEYDSLNRLTKVTQPNNLVTTYEYDANNNRTAMVDAKGQRTQMSYDEIDRVRAIDYFGAGSSPVVNGARRQQFTYDPENNVTQVDETTANNGLPSTRQYKRTYDARDRLLTSTDANNRVISYGYDAANNVVSLTDAAQKQTNYGYDALNRLSTVTLPTSQQVTYGWKADGKLDRVTYPSGMSRAYAYDDADRVTSITNTIGTSDKEEFAYTYDANSNRISETKKRNNALLRQITYGYDELNRLISTGYGSANQQGLKGEYFDNGDLTNRKFTRTDSQINFLWAGTQTPDARIADNTYSVRWTGKIEAQFSETYTFYVQSDAGVRLWVNGQLLIDKWTAHTSQEDSATIQLQANQKVDIKLEYTEDTGDAEVKLSWSSASQTKQVVPQSRLSIGADPALNYTYDAVGNRLSESGVNLAFDTVNRTYSYNELNRLTGVTGDAEGALTFSYDANGNLNSQTQGSQTTRYEYDTRDQLRKVFNGVSGTDLVAAYDYDYARRRVSKSSASETLSYVYDGSRVINEYGASGNLQNRYDFGADLLRSELGGEGERYYFSDALGSTTSMGQVVSGAASVASQSEYDAWGGVVNVTSPGANRVGYTGQRLDNETGLMALGNGERYYSPNLGQFIQQDSVSGSLTNPQGLNRHSYVENNPLSFSDPSGHEPSMSEQGYWAGKRERSVVAEAQASSQEYHIYNSFVDISNNPFLTNLGFSLMVAYNAVDFYTAGFVTRQDRTVSLYQRGKISLSEAVFARTTLNLLTLLPQVIGESFGPAGDVVGSMVQQGVAEYYEKQFEGREEYSPWWSYALTGATTGLAHGVSRVAGKWVHAVKARSLLNGEARAGLGSFLRFGKAAAGDVIAGERAALRSWSAGLRAASSEGQMISQSVSQGYNASLVLRCGEELDEATASLVEMAESSGVAVSIRKECFVAGTLIHTREGEKAIEEIGEGDEVLSYNPQTQQTEYKPVVQTFTHEARELLNVGIEGESEALGVTPTHPFYVRRARDCTSDGDGDDSPSEASRGEWVAAKELKAGDLVRRPNGEWVRVEKVESRAKGERVYNFEVADNHNYFVGERGTLVHNTCNFNTRGGTGANYDILNGQGLYVLIDNKNVVRYVGRGDAFARTARHQFDPAKMHLKARILFENNLSKAQAKGLEQHLIDHYGGTWRTNPRPQLLNDINSYASSNKNANLYKKAATPAIVKETINRLKLGKIKY